MAHTRQETRANNWKHAIRKRKIARAVYHSDKDYYDNLHQFSKNKIHCSCPKCQEVEKKISEQRRIEQMETQKQEGS